jgi:hypothetical protein
MSTSGANSRGSISASPALFSSAIAASIKAFFLASSSYAFSLQTTLLFLFPEALISSNNFLSSSIY